MNVPSSSSSSVTPKAGSRKFLGLSSSTKGFLNWEIPPFPGDKKGEEEKTCEENDVRQFVSRSTQVKDRDWALLEVKQSGNSLFELGSNGTNAIPDGDDGSNYKNFGDNSCGDSSYRDYGASNNDDNDVEKIVFTRLCTRGRGEPRIDRGTSCDDFPGDFGYEEKVLRLHHDFPKADEAHIREVLNACHDDYIWAFNLLSQFNEQHFTASSLTLNALDDLDYGEEERLDLPEPEETKYEEIYSERNDQQAQFTFNLDPAFAIQLQQSFGQVLKDGQIDDKYLQVQCSLGVAKLIHHLWVKTYNANVSSKEFTSSNHGSPYKPNFSKSSGNNSSKKKDSSTKKLPYQPKSAFEEIMDLEMALNLSRKDFNSSTNGYFNSVNGKNHMSTKLKREQLKAVYPGLDEQILEEIFEANNYKIKETIESIDFSFGIETKLNYKLKELVKDETGGYLINGIETAGRPFSPESNIPNNNHLDQLRAQISECHERKKELMEKAQKSYQCKKYAVASYFTSQARDFQRELEDLRQQVIECIISANPSNYLDLHGVHSNEVLTTLKQYLASKHEELNRTKRNKLKLFIITGRGAHSGVGGPKLKPLVLQYLKQKRYKADILNPGVIGVTIP